MPERNKRQDQRGKANDSTQRKYQEKIFILLRFVPFQARQVEPKQHYRQPKKDKSPNDQLLLIKQLVLHHPNSFQKCHKNPKEIPCSGKNWRLKNKCIDPYDHILKNIQAIGKPEGLKKLRQGYQGVDNDPESEHFLDTSHSAVTAWRDRNSHFESPSRPSGQTERSDRKEKN